MITPKIKKEAMLGLYQACQAIQTLRDLAAWKEWELDRDVVRMIEKADDQVGTLFRKLSSVCESERQTMEELLKRNEIELEEWRNRNKIELEELRKRNEIELAESKSEKAR